MTVPLARDDKSPNFINGLLVAILLLDLIVLLPLVILPLLLNYPRFQLNNGQLTIQTLTTTLRVPRAVAEKARLTTLDITRKNVGINAPGLCVGTFTDAELGQLRLYSNCSEQAVIFAFQGRTYAITPAEPQEFLRAWQAGSTSTFRTPRTGLSGVTISTIVVLLGMLTLLAWLLRRTKRLAYQFDQHALRLTTAFSTLRLPYRHIQSATLAQKQPGVRLFGTGLPGYFTGRFAFGGNGPPVVHAVASSITTTGVLINVGERTYYLTPAQPTTFLEELNQRRNALSGPQPRNPSAAADAWPRHPKP